MPARTKQALSRDRVLAAGVALADAEGLAAVTMRRVATALDCEAMSLYHHVPDKKALLGGLAETVVGETVVACLDPALTAGASDWRDVVRRRCLAAREVMLRHPWAPPLLATADQPPPNTYLLFEALVGTMADAGCSYPLAHKAIHALGSMLLGFTSELFEPSPDDAEVTPEVVAALEATFPHLARVAVVAAHEAEGALSVCDTAAEFAFTLGLVLDGLEAHRLRGTV